MRPDHARGRQAELRVRKEIERRGLKIFAERVKVAGVEVDLLASDQSTRIIVIEVKSLSSPHWIGERLPFSQKQRLRRVAMALACGWPLAGWRPGLRDVELWLALVPPTPHAIEFFQDF